MVRGGPLTSSRGLTKSPSWAASRSESDVWLRSGGAWRDAAVVAALRGELEASRPLVGADLEDGIPVLESADAIRDHVVRFISHVLDRGRRIGETPRMISATEWSAQQGAGPVA